MLKKMLFALGASLRNPSLRSYLSFLKESDQWTEKKLIDYQTNKCKQFLEFAYKYSPFYKDIFDNHNFNPAEFNDLTQLKKLPSISKETLIKHNNQIQSGYPFKKLFLANTSGSTGVALEFFRDEEWDSCNRATIFRGYSWYNVKPWDLNAYLWGYNINPKEAFKIKILDWLQNRFRLFSYSNIEIEKFALKLRSAKYLHGYSSMIYEVAKRVNKIGNGRDYNLKMIKGTAEKIYEGYQEEVKKAFGQKIISEYGSTESGTIAFECPKGNMHISMENVIVEEENGEIVVTNLLSRSFPIIRYKLGDGIQLAGDDFKCSCGRAHMIISELQGRIGQKIIGAENEYSDIALYYVFKNLIKKYKVAFNYQARQDVKGFVELSIEQEENYNTILKEELKKYFRNDVEFNIKYGQNLHNMDGKFKDFITTLDD